MSELEVLQRAKTYVDKLANGVNPLDDSYLSENDIVNNVRISRCLFYVSDILNQVIENGGSVTKKRTRKEGFTVSDEELQNFKFSNAPISISEIAKRLNDLVTDTNIKNITHNNLSEWLVSIDMLKVEVSSEGKKLKRPTENGLAIGISTESRTSLYGTYTVVLYNREAQQFIIDNLPAVLALMNDK